MSGTEMQRGWIKDVLGVSFPAASAGDGGRRQDSSNDAHAKPPPFQLFVKGLDNVTITITLPNGQDTKLGHLQRLIEDRTGIAPAEQNLTTGTKPFNSRHADLTVSDYGLQPNQTLSLQGRLKGGFGERAAIADVILKELRRGNVLSDIKDSGGQTTAKVVFHRAMFGDLPAVEQGQQRHPVEQYLEQLPAEGTALLNEVADEAVRRMDQSQDGFDAEAAKQDWLRDHGDAVKAMAISGGKAANCSDYSKVVYTSLLAKTNGQTVYQVAMEGGDYDHQFVVTCPTNYGNDIAQLMADGDAMVADGWWENRICTFARFLEGTDDDGNSLNPYDAVITAADLKIKAVANATGQEMDDQVAAFAAGKFKDLYDKYATEIGQGATEYDKFTEDTPRIFGQEDDDWNTDQPVDKRTRAELYRTLELAHENGGVDQWAKELKSLSNHELITYLDDAEVPSADIARAIRQAYSDKPRRLELIWELAGQNEWLLEMRTLLPQELAAYMKRPKVKSDEKHLVAHDATLRNTLAQFERSAS